MATSWRARLACGSVLWLASALLLIWLLAGHRFYRDFERLERQMANLQKDIQQGLIMEAQLVEFQREIEEVGTRRQAVVAILPERTELERLLEHLREIAANEAVELRMEEPPRPGSGEHLPQGLGPVSGLVATPLGITLVGPSGDTERLLRRICQGHPLLLVEDVVPGEERTRASLVALSLPREPPEPSEDPCAAPGDEPGTEPPSGVSSKLPDVVPPFRGWLDDMRRRMTESCAEKRRLEAIIAEVHGFTTERDDLQRRIDAIRGIPARPHPGTWCDAGGGDRVRIVEE